MKSSTIYFKNSDENCYSASTPIIKIHIRTKKVTWSSWHMNYLSRYFKFNYDKLKIKINPGE